MGSLVKKRRKKMSKHKYRKRIKANRHKRKEVARSRQSPCACEPEQLGHHPAATAYTPKVSSRITA